MTRFHFHYRYNDTEFRLQPAGKNAWDIERLQPDGRTTLVGTHLFAGVPAEQAALRAQALVRKVCPVGVKTVGPDVAHPLRIGDLKLVGPDVNHASFVYWEQDSSSFPKQP